MRLRRLAIPITIVGVVLMLAGAGTVPAAARVQEPGVTAPSAAAMNLPAVATDTPETSAASGPAPESVVRVRVNPSPASTSAKTSAPDWKTDPPDSPTAVSGEEASPAGAAAARGTVNALEPPEGPAVQESAAHTFRDIAVDDGGEGSAAGKQEEPGAGGQPVFQAAAVNSYDITLKPGSNLISLPLIPDYNADVGQDQRDIGSAEESPASVRLVAEVPAPVESAASLTLVDLNNNLLKLEANRFLRESDHAIPDTDPSFSHIVTGGDTSNFKPDGTQGTPQLASKGSITCDPGSSPKATKKFEAAISVTNHTLSEDDELYVIVTFSREIYEWSRERKSSRFSLEQGDTYTETGEFRSLLPGEGYAIECELRRHLTGPYFIGWPDELVATDRKTFSVGDFQSTDLESVARITECSASPSNLQVGDTVTLQVIAMRKKTIANYTAAAFIQIFRDAKLVDSYPPPGQARRDSEEEVIKLTTTTGIDRTGLVDYTFTPSEPGLYTAYCFLHTGAVKGFTAKTRNENATLNDYYKVLSLFLPGGGPAIDFWSGILSGYFSHLESVKSVHFCVGDPEDCEFYSTSDDESSGEPDLEVESLTVSKSAMEPGETFTLTASVRNSGSGESSKTTLRYYRSTTSTFFTSVMEDSVIGVSGLDPSYTERVSHPLAAPSDPGLYYYRTCVAPASGESDTDNNCSTGVRVTVEATQQGSPDLVVEAPSVSKNEIQPGGRFTLFATVRNIGDARAGSAILQYYRSTDSSISAGSDTKVGSDTVDSLQPSRTDGESVGVSAPEAPGEYYYGACVVRVTGGESDTGNNCSSGRRVTVAQATTKPDLVVDSPSVSQNEVDAGGRFTLRTTVRNSGDGPAPAATLRYYRSADSTITTGDAEVETDRVRYLDPSETGDESERLTAPSSAGTYYYGACVDWVTDESDTNNNCSSGVQVTVTEALQNSPDLVVSVSIGDTELEPGETFAVTSWVSNSGLATSPATTLRIYRSTDSSISAGDTVIGVGNVRSLAPSETQGYDLRNQIAPSVAGTYYYGSCVESVSGESDTTNNCSSGVRVTVEQTNPAAFARNPSQDFKVLAPGNTSPWGLWSDGETMWVSDEFGGRIYAYDLDTKERITEKELDSTLASGNNQLMGIWSNGETLWVADLGSRRIYAYDLDTKQREPSNEFNSLPANGNIRPLGIASDGTTLWTSGFGHDDLYAFSLSSKARTSTKDIAALGFYTHTMEGLWYERGTGRVWVVAGRVKKVFTFDTTVGTRTALEFDVKEEGESANIISPRGIWSDGETVWIADWANDRILAFYMPGRVKASFQKFYVIDVDLDEYGDHDRECKLQLGGEYRLADWNDLKEYYAAGGSIPELISGLNWKDENTTDVGMKYLKVSKDGNERWGGSRRHYFVSRHDHVRPGYFLVHDHIDNYHLSLGSWYWRGGEALCMPSAGDAATDRAALVALYNATGGANWGNNGKWLSNAPMGEWHGVTTDSDGRVTHLDLRTNQLTGEIPAELGDLTNLTELQLRSNQLTGEIPAELGSLTNLGGLYLRSNQLTGEIPAELGSLSNLRGLYLNSNQLTGEIPAELGGLSNLTVLGLSGNQLTGEIPAELGSLSNLTVLGLSGNQLTGEIPAELGSLPNLQFLRLQGNRLTGCIPAGLRNVPDNDLDELGLDDCEARVPFARNPAEDFNGLSAAKNNHPVGIWSDGTTMWVADTADDKIYAYNLGTKARDAGKDFNTLAGAGNNNPEGIWSDGTTMWVVDQQDDKIYAYDMAAKARDTGKDFSTLPDADGFPDNIWSDRTTMWLADPLGPAKLYAYNLGTKARDAGKDFNTLIDAGNSRPEGIWSDGTTMWVADQQDDKIYAYDMATKARDTGKDFNTLAGAGNNLPAGLWSDEATIWVADYVDGKIYAYNMPAASAGDAATDRAALVALYNATGGANWGNNRNWLSNAPMGEWHGVITDSDGRVTHLDIRSNQLTGEIPAELGDLTNLTELQLRSNQLTGAIPAELGNLTNLEGLDLYGNQLTGAIPAELGNLTNLTHLYLSGNQLTGAIPAELGNLANLQTLHLYSNQLTGEIPAELGSLPSLQSLWLQGNQLTGEIPAELGSLPSLEVLDLRTNQLTGEIPAELGDLTNLEGLWLASNQLTGAIPAELGYLTNVEVLRLASNQLTGAIPAELGNLTNLELLSLNSNQLTGAIPAELGNLTNLKGLSLYSNQLTGEIPAELADLSNLEYLYLFNNQLTGEISAELGNLTNLKYLYLYDNQLTGAIPAELGNLTNLTHLWLSSNQLTGEIPAELGNLTSLLSLELYLNQLTGEIPAELGTLTSLRWLWLDRNQLTGEIPAELGNLTNLIRLHLSSNQLTGEIPAELGDLTNLKGLRLYDNQLTGEIPAELGDLSNLTELQLRSNQLTGCIPEGLRNIRRNDFGQLGLPFCGS